VRFRIPRRLLLWIVPRLTLGILLLRQLLDRLGEGLGHLPIPALIARCVAALTAVEVVLTSGALEHFAALGDFEPLQQCFVCLHILYKLGGEGILRL